MSTAPVCLVFTSQWFCRLGGGSCLTFAKSYNLIPKLTWKSHWHLVAIVIVLRVSLLCYFSYLCDTFLAALDGSRDAELFTHHFDRDWNILRTTGWIAINFLYRHSWSEDESYWLWWFLDCPSSITMRCNSECNILTSIGWSYVTFITDIQGP